LCSVSLCAQLMAARWRVMVDGTRPASASLAQNCATAPRPAGRGIAARGLRHLLQRCRGGAIRGW